MQREFERNKLVCRTQLTVQARRLSKKFGRFEPMAFAKLNAVKFCSKAFTRPCHVTLLTRSHRF